MSVFRLSSSILYINSLIFTKVVSTVSIAELKLFIKSSKKCLLTSFLNSGLSTKKGIGVPCTSLELNVSSETSVVILDILCQSFKVKNESKRLAVARFSSFPDAINKSILVPSISLSVQSVATIPCMSLNMVSVFPVFTS